MSIPGFRASVGIALVWVIFAPGRAVAQVTVDIVTGQVTLVDSSGDPVDRPDIGVISGLVVYLANEDSGLAWRSETNEDGMFYFERVPEGSYKLQVIYNGETIRSPGGDLQRDVTVSADQDTLADVRLLVEEQDVVVADVEVAETVETDNVQTDTLTGWRFGLGFGLSSLDYFPATDPGNCGGTGDLSFCDFSFRVALFTAFVTLNENWYFSVLWGLRPVLGEFEMMADPAGSETCRSKSCFPLFGGDRGDRRENIAAFHVSYYFTDAPPDEIGISWGGALGYQLAWEVVPEFDEYVKRAAGFTAGGRARVRWLPRRIEAVLGLDVQVSDMSEFGISPEELSVWGLALSGSFNYVF